MSDVSIRIEDLGKRYSIRHAAAARRSTTLADTLASQWRRLTCPGAARHGQADASVEDVWVLQDVNLEIPRGEIVGIIGRNGAGKSTLLKILSGITEPTRGRALIQGRVASLLEVGTGFHPELTGRENVYLNGAILGMTAEEIGRKFDEIVAFSGVERFLDTPVKRYSSGMYVRLAFAVASHLEPDVLIVDEVLAVGDMDFQRKCLGRMGEVSKEGRTVLFVSHNLPMISALCDECVLLEGGRMVAKGPTAKILPLYHGASFTPAKEVRTQGEPTANKLVVLASTWITGASGSVIDRFSIFDEIRLHVAYDVLDNLDDAVIPFFHVLNAEGNYVFLTFPHDGPSLHGTPAGRYEAVCRIPPHLLNDGSYSVTVQANTVGSGHTLQFFEHHALRFVVLDPIHENPYRARVRYSYEIPGSVRPLLDWRIGKSVQQSEAIK